MPARGVRPRCLPPAFLAALVAILVPPGCHLLVDVPVPRPLPVPEGVSPLTTTELLSFTSENLGEVSPGILYRSSIPSRELIGFLAERARLGYILNLREKTHPKTAAFIEQLGIVLVPLRMSARRDPTPHQILEMIRLTHRARSEGRSILMHCRAGADRTGVMIAIWRMLFQGVTDRDALRDELFLHRHLSPFYPNIVRTVERFRPDLFLPFVEDPSLLDDPEQLASLEVRYFQSQPLRSGTTRVTRGPLRAGVAKADLLDGSNGGVPMASRGPPSGAAEDRRGVVYARALVLENGSVRLAIVSCDMLLMEASLRREVFQLARRRGMAFDDILLAATHSHTNADAFADHSVLELSGALEETMRDHLARRITDALGEALAGVRSARLGVGRSFVDGLSKNNRIGTTVDREVGIIKVTADDGEQLAVVVNFAAHPLPDSPGGITSPEYPGLLARKLDEHCGFGLFLQGASGDVAARGAGGSDTGEPAESVAQRLAQSVKTTIDAIATEREVQLGSMTMLVDLPGVNVSLIPDLFFPLDWLLAGLLEWPLEAPLQSLRIGDAAIVASSTELGVRLGLRIKRRSPSPFPLVVTHANAYAGSAFTAVNHAKRKFDVASLMSLRGSRHGAAVVEAACDLMEAQWGRRLDPEADLLTPAEAARLGLEREGPRTPDHAAEWRDAVTREEEAALLRADSTLPQTRRVFGLLGDPLPEGLRLEVGYAYQEDVRGGQRVEGRHRATHARLDLRAPWDVRLSGDVAYVRSEWKATSADGEEEGATDFTFGLERPFAIFSEHLEGTALRATPRLAVTAPTGNAEPEAPFAFALSTGVWRPAAGGALQLTWETYRTLEVEGLYTTSLDRRYGRRPGDRFEGAVSYRERHGVLSISLDFTAELLLPDSRRGGRLEVDVEETSFELGLRPGLTLHLGECFELSVQGIVPLAHGGSGGGSRLGVGVGAVAGF